MLYALATNVICKHDNTGKWEPNYSNVGGNIIAGAISNLYYPSQNSGWGQTLSNGMIVTAEGGFGSLFQEFWPDISPQSAAQGSDARPGCAGSAAGQSDTKHGSVAEIRRPAQWGQESATQHVFISFFPSFSPSLHSGVRAVLVTLEFSKTQWKRETWLNLRSNSEPTAGAA